MKRPANLIRASVSIQDIDEKDGKLAYQVYRLGNLPEYWQPADGMKPTQFLEALGDFIDQNYTHAWSVRDGDPIGIVFGKSVVGANIIGDVIWSPKATPRQKLEAHAKFFSEIKHSVVLSDFENKKFYERLMDYGILRRVGTNYIEGKRMAQFETR